MRQPSISFKSPIGCLQSANCQKSVSTFYASCQSFWLTLKIRYYLLLLSIAVVLNLVITYHLLPPVSLSLTSVDALPVAAVIIDLGILLLIVYTDLLNPIFLDQSL
jgi:hypothetical protein